MTKAHGTACFILLFMEYVQSQPFNACYVLPYNISHFGSARMGITCIVEGCGNCKERPEEGKNILFHQLPADEIKRKLWIENIVNSSCGFKKNLKAVGGKSCVCSEHFRESDYILGFTGTKRLNYKLAVPFSTVTNCKVNMK